MNLAPNHRLTKMTTCFLSGIHYGHGVGPPKVGFVGRKRVPVSFSSTFSVLSLEYHSSLRERIGCGISHVFQSRLQWICRPDELPTHLAWLIALAPSGLRLTRHRWTGLQMYLDLSTSSFSGYL